MSVSIPERRREGRRRILMDVRCRIGPGMSPLVWLTDITTFGCQLVIREGSLKEEQNVVIKLEGIDGISGKVTWVYRSNAGIEFERPLHEAVLKHVLSGRRDYEALNRRDAVDQFGRSIPERPGPSPTSGSKRRPCS